MISSMALIYTVVLWVLAPSSLVTTDVSDEPLHPSSMNPTHSQIENTKWNSLLAFPLCSKLKQILVL